MSSVSTEPDRFPIRFLTTAMLLTAIVLCWFGWNTYDSYHIARTIRERHFRVQELQGEITHLDEVLTMSARMAAATGDSSWEERYRRFEPMLDRAIKEVIRLQPGAYSGEDASRTAAANIRLVEMAHLAFDLLRRNQGSEARRVLFSAEYETQKLVYSQGMAAVSTLLKKNANDMLESLERTAFLNSVVLIAALPALLFGWLFVFRTVKRWQLRLNTQARQLLDLNAHLDARVTERTAELQQTIKQLKLTESELEEARDSAEHANRAKSEFLANMSHEIRTPMNGILGMTELMIDSNPTAEQSEFLEMVKSSADSLMTIIDDILDFSKIEAGRLDLEFVPFRLRELLTLAAKALAVTAQEKNLELIVDAEGIPDSVVGDPTRLRQVVMNLIGNAIKFTFTGEIVVRVAAAKPANHTAAFSFSVSDTGIGIPAAKQPMIFEAFTQADGSTTRHYGGTGLGLAISAKLVRMMGGQLRVDSTLGMGSTFHFEIPLGVETPAAEPVADRFADLTGVSVLVVDDNATNCRIFETMLTRWRMTPSVVRDGPSAIEAMLSAEKAGSPFRLVILDSNMPGMDGFTVVEQARANPLLAGATIMMLTSAGREDDTRRCSELGLAAYLMKPIAQSSLFDAIKAIIGVQRATPSRTSGTATPAIPVDSLYILVAEDNPVNQVLIRRLLEKLGHRVHLVDTGVKVLEALACESFDLILMDVQMPDLDGLEATKAIRENEKESGAHIPIIALTAHAMKADRERCLAAGMDAFLSKPIELKQLVSAIHAVGRANVLPVNA